MFNMLIFLFAKSSNINEVIRAVLNFFFFFYKKIYKKAPKAQKKDTKTQPSKSTKTQISKQKFKMFKKHLSGKK